MHIVELEKYQVLVFLRLRRFGKSMFCTMLDYYYDLNEANRFERLFGDIWIGQHPDISIVKAGKTGISYFI